MATLPTGSAGPIGPNGRAFDPNALAIDATNMISPEELEAMIAVPHPPSRGAGPAFAPRAVSLSSLLDPVLDALAVETIGGFLPRVDWTGHRPAFVVVTPPPGGRDGADIERTALIAEATTPLATGPATRLAELRVGDFFARMRWDGSPADLLGAVAAAVDGLPTGSGKPEAAPAVPQATIDSVFGDFVW